MNNAIFRKYLFIPFLKLTIQLSIARPKTIFWTRDYKYKFRADHLFSFERIRAKKTYIWRLTICRISLACICG